MSKRQPLSANPYETNHHLLSMYKNQPPFSGKVQGASTFFTNLLRKQQLQKPVSPPPKNLFNRQIQQKKHKRNNNSNVTSKKSCIRNSTKAASMRNLEKALMKMPKKNLTKLILNGNF